MAIDHAARAHLPLRSTGRLRWLAYHLFSLETVLVLFLYAAHLKALLPPLPIPETVVYGAISIAIGGWVVMREGIYRGGIPVVIGGFVLAGWMFASYAWSPSTSMARESLPFVVGINLWAVFAAACIVAGSRERVLRLLLLLVLLAGILGAYGTYVELVHGNFRFYQGAYGDWHRRTYLAWSNTAMTGAAIALALTLNTRFGSAKQLAASAVFCFCLYFLMISGARGALLGTLFAGIIAFIATPPEVRDGRIAVPRAQMLALALVIAIAGYFAYLVATDQSPTTIARFLRLFDQADDPLLRSGANRFDYYAGAYRAWLAAPVFGQGLSGFSTYFCGFDQQGCHPHNIFLQSLADHGVIGGVLILVFLALGFRRYSLARLRADPLCATVLMAFATIFVYVMVAVELPTAHRFFFFVGLLALRPPLPDDDDEA